MTIREAINLVTVTAAQNLHAYAVSLISARYTGKGGRLWTEFLRLYLSGREEKADAYYVYPGTQQILSWAVTIHRKRGTEQGIIEDTRRICNNPNATVTYFDKTKCGWILGLTSPGFLNATTYNPNKSPVFLGITNMVHVECQNSGNRSNTEVESIVRREFIPIRYNLRVFLTK